MIRSNPNAFETGRNTSFILRSAGASRKLISAWLTIGFDTRSDLTSGQKKRIFSGIHAPGRVRGPGPVFSAASSLAFGITEDILYHRNRFQAVDLR